jgi:hypothetical protein
MVVPVHILYAIETTLAIASREGPTENRGSHAAGGRRRRDDGRYRDNDKGDDDDKVITQIYRGSNSKTSPYGDSKQLVHKAYFSGVHGTYFRETVLVCTGSIS